MEAGFLTSIFTRAPTHFAASELVSDRPVKTITFLALHIAS